MVQNCSIEEVCNKTFAYSYSGIRSIERTLRSQLSKCYASLDEITCFLLLLLLYRYDEECGEAVPSYLKLKSVSNLCHNYEMEPSSQE